MPVQNAPQRARKPRQPARRSVFSFLPKLSRWPRRRIVLAGVILIAATGIAVNALVLQSARHPAPLFAAVEQARVDAARKAAAAARAQAAQTAVPLPPARPVADATPPAPIPTPASAQQSQPAAAPQTEPQSLARLMADAAEKPARATPDKSASDKSAKPASEKPVAQEKPAQEKPAQDKQQPRVAAKPDPKADALGEFIRGGIVPPGGIPSEPDPKIQQAQRALTRLGATNVKPDGFMGPATKAAIEKFERDKKWPVTGEISPRLLRELGAVSAARP